jgi:hypothetical protein
MTKLSILNGSTFAVDDQEVPPEAIISLPAWAIVDLVATVHGQGWEAGLDAAIKSLSESGRLRDGSDPGSISAATIARGVAYGLRDAKLSLDITAMPTRTVERQVTRDRRGAISGTFEVESDA